MDEIGYLIVARCTDGGVVRGTSDDFRPDRFFFHVWDGQSHEQTRVLRDQLKAVFFVKTLDGDPLHVERKTFDVDDSSRTKVWVRFQDGEQLAGWTDEYDERQKGFTLYPTDPESNIAKAWVPHAATDVVRLGEEAEEASQVMVGTQVRAHKRRITPRDWDAMLSIEPADIQRARTEHQRRLSMHLREQAEARRTPRR